MRPAFLADQTVGKDNRLIRCGNPVERFTVVGIGDGGDIVTEADPLEHGTHRKEEKSGNEFESAAILCHGTNFYQKTVRKAIILSLFHYRNRNIRDILLASLSHEYSQSAPRAREVEIAFRKNRLRGESPCGKRDDRQRVAPDR
jgi:hypothetical protein